MPGYLAIPLTNDPIVTNGATTVVTNPYYPAPPAASGALGSLTVNITPANLAGTGWRFFGETGWSNSGATALNLLPDTYLIQFEPVSGYVTPPSLAVPVSNGKSVQLAGNYTPAPSAPLGVNTPESLSTGDILDYPQLPYGFSGQLQTDMGVGSGAAVRKNVVLTAAHMVFNDNTLSYVSNAFWSFQEQAGVYQPEPQAARGWYVLSGYAAQRVTDILTNGFSADQSSPQSRDQDVAALYFLTAAARTGYGGYVSSDAVPNPYLTGSSFKTLVGYPVDGSMFGVLLTPGVMYATPLDPQPFFQTNDQVYAASWLFSYPGNSGGPLCVQYANGLYYPAAVYLGTLFDSGGQPSATVVRAIDSNVVNLITRASDFGDTGTNNSGGGVITIIPSQATSIHNPSYLILQLGPAAAVQAGAAWKLTNQPANYYSTANPSLQEITSTSALAVQFKPIPGWNLPTNRTVTVVPGVILTNVANYTVTNPLLTLDLVNGLRISGTEQHSLSDSEQLHAHRRLDSLQDQHLDKLRLQSHHEQTPPRLLPRPLADQLTLTSAYPLVIHPLNTNKSTTPCNAAAIRTHFCACLALHFSGMIPNKARKSSRLPGFFLAGIIFFFAGLLQAQLIDVDFNNNSFGSSQGDPGPNPGPTMSGAAVLGTAGDQWNGINVSSGSGVALFYADGSASGVTMTFTSGGGYDVNNFSGPYPFAGTPYDALMEDYLFNGGTAQTITLSGLATNSIYSLVLYNAADAAVSGRETFFTVNGKTQASVWDGVTSTLVAGVDYVNFTPALSDGSGNLVITYTGNGGLQGDIDGFQLQGPSNLEAARTNDTATYAWTTLAGHPPNGSADGTADTVEFKQPEGVAVDGAGNVYVADSGNNTIRRITQGQVSSTIAGIAGNSGANDGAGGAALFNFPAAVAADRAGNLYVTDQNNHTIRKLTPAGANWIVSTIAGVAGSSGTNDGAGGDARFFSPAGIAVDNAANLYVTDNDTVRRITLSGSNWVVTTMAGLAGSSGNLDAVGSDARFNGPIGIGVDNSSGAVSGNSNAIYAGGFRQQLHPADYAADQLAGRGHQLDGEHHHHRQRQFHLSIRHRGGQCFWERLCHGLHRDSRRGSVRPNRRCDNPR